MLSCLPVCLTKHDYDGDKTQDYNLSYIFNFWIIYKANVVRRARIFFPHRNTILKVTGHKFTM